MKKSIKNKMILSFLVVLIIPTTVISIMSYRISVNLLEEKVSDSFLSNLNFIGQNIEKKLEEWEEISKFISVNPVIRSVIMKTYENDLDFYTDMKQVDEQMDMYSINTNIFSYVSSMVILGNNGNHLLYGPDANRLDIERIKKQEWFSEINQLNGQVKWLGIHKNIANYSVQNESVIALGRAIKGKRSDEIIGTLYLTFSETYFTDYLKKVELKDGERLYIVDNLDHVVFDSEKKLLNETFPELSEIEDHQNESSFKKKVTKEEQLLFAHVPIEKYGWKIVETVPYASLTKGSYEIFRNTVIIFLAAFILTSIIWLFVSSHIVRPIVKLTNSMKKVQEGDLSVRVNIERKDEVGLMSHHFNFMLKRIRELFDSNLEEQEKKKNAEYKALQAQINPHFLYNTLNTIRWMAIIQKSDNIREMVEVLGRLLKNTIKHEGNFVTIAEEISNLRDYIYIQKIRYNNNFEVKYDIQEEALELPCVKFILQPIVENAIFHGIEPKEDRGGEIIITIKRQSEQLLIRIWDNGVGLSEQTQLKLDKLANDPEKGHGIGMSNVIERLKLTYGEASVFRVRSEKNRFTEIEMIFPISVSNLQLQAASEGNL